MVTVHLKATNLDMSDLPKLKVIIFHYNFYEILIGQFQKEISLILPLVQAIMEQGVSYDKQL